jgi:hypothetical protein
VVCTINYYAAIIVAISLQARVFDLPFNSSVIFAGKAGASDIGVPYRTPFYW